MWKVAIKQSTGFVRQHEFPMGHVVLRYKRDFDSSQRLYSEELELLVHRWLLRLAESQGVAPEEPERTLQEVGLLDAIRGASIDSGYVYDRVR